MKQQPVGALMLFYVVGRFVVFGLIVGAFYLFGFRGFPGLIAAAILSIPVSYFALKPVRERLSLRLYERQQQKQADREDFRAAGAESEGTPDV